MEFLEDVYCHERYNKLSDFAADSLSFFFCPADGKAGGSTGSWRVKTLRGGEKIRRSTSPTGPGLHHPDFKSTSSRGVKLVSRISGAQKKCQVLGMVF